MLRLTIGCLILFFALHGIRPAISQDSESPSDEVAESPYVMNSNTGKKIELADLILEIAGSDVIVLGEQHDNDAGHRFQLAVIEKLVANGNKLAISMEQFERDVQGVVNDYLAGRITEEEFLKHSRPWPNYEKHYRPVVEFAKKSRLPIIAGNVPRRLASSSATNESLKSLDKVFLPRATSAPQDRYWENFQDSMKGHGGIENDGSMERFYAAQCLKDDAMAEAITDYLVTCPHETKTVVHLCGHFHSDYGLGTVARVYQRRPLARISVVTMETMTKKDSDIEKAASRGHFVFWTVKNNSAKSAESDKPEKSEKSDKNKVESE